MLSKQPLRYLLADDPGAGKTIMTDLLIKELMIRGDLHRCLIVSPSNLVELGHMEAVVTIHGGVKREERLQAQETFTQNAEFMKNRAITMSISKNVRKEP